MRLVFVGSPPFAAPVLTRLLASPFRPTLVVTTPDRPRGRERTPVENELARLARDAEVPVAQPQTVREEGFLAGLRAAEPEVVLVCAYGEYLDTEFRSIASRETLNVHPSLLPRHRGASPIQAAVRAGDRTTGVSIQRVVKEMDAGDVTIALECEIGSDETAGELTERLAELGGEASVLALEALEAGTARFEPQDEARVTLCSKLSKADGALDWSRPAEELANLVRAMNPWPLARTELDDGRELLVLVARRADGDPGSAPDPEPGRVLEATDRLVVATGDGALELCEVKPAGKRAMPAAAFLRGARLEVGARLGS